MNDAQINTLIDQKIAKAMAFATKKYGDIPTDSDQLTPKGYVTSVVAGIPSVAGISVTDGVHTVNPATTVNFTDGATVSVLGGGVAGVRITASVLAAGNNTQLQYNSASVLGGVAIDYTFGGSNPIVYRLDVEDAGAFTGATLIVDGSLSTTTQGGLISMTAGVGNGTSRGGHLVLEGGPANGTGDYGNVQVAQGQTTTTRNGCFLVVPFCSGTPTGTPTSSPAMVYDTSANKLWIYNGSWRSVAVT